MCGRKGLREGLNIYRDSLDFLLFLFLVNGLGKVDNSFVVDGCELALSGADLCGLHLGHAL